MLTLKARLSGLRGSEFRSALTRFQAQVARVNERWTHAEQAVVLSNPRLTATRYAESKLEINPKGASRMLDWARRLPEREEF